MKNIKTIDCRRPSLLFLPLCVFFVLMIIGTMAEVKAQVIINDDFSSPASLANWTQVQTRFNGGTYNVVGGNLQLYTSGGSSGFWGQMDVMEIKAIYPTMPSNFCNIEFSLNLEQVSIVQYGGNKSATGVDILIGDGSNSTSIQNGIFIELHGFYRGYAPDFPYPYNVWSGNRLIIWEIIGGVSTRIGYIDYTPFVLANIDIKIVHQNNVWKVLHKQSFETTYNTVNIPTFNAISGLNFIARISSGDGGFTMQNAMGSVNISNFTVTQLGLNPPASVTASALNSNSIKLDWVDNVCNETAFKIQRSLTSGSGFADIGTVAANVTTFTNTGLTAGTTYYYRVIATNGGGDSAPSNEASDNTLNFGLVAYYPFSGNANDASGNGNNGTVNGATLTTDRFCNPNGAYSFNGVSDYIEVANSPSLEGVTSLSICGWVRPNGVYGTGYIPILEKSSTTLNGLYYLGIYQDGTDYYYYGSLQNNFYRADLITPLVLSDWYYFTAIFTGTTAEYYLNNQLVAVTSQSVIGGFTTNDVLRIGANPAGITEFLNGTLDEVRIYNRALSASEVATLYDLPAAPSLLSATTFSATQVNLAWTDNASNEDGYVVERSLTSGSSFAVLATLAANTVSYSDMTAIEGNIYFYRVNATKSCYQTPYPNEASATIAFATPTVSGITAPIPFSVQLTFADNSTIEDNVEIERSLTTGTGFTVLATLAPNATTYTDNTVSEGITYFYRLRNFKNPSLYSPYSTEASVSTPTFNAPSGLVAAAIDITRIDIDWLDNTIYEDGYSVERSLLPMSGFAVITTLPAGTVAYTDNSVLPATQYYYRVRATKLALFSAYSNVAAATTADITPLEQATNIVLTNIFSQSLGIGWTNGSGTSRIVKINTTNNFTNLVNATTYTANSNYLGIGEQIIYNSGGNTTFVGGLQPKTKYFFKVYEYNGGLLPSSGVTASYLNTSAQGNPSSFLTFANTPTNPPTNLVFTDITASAISGIFTAANPKADGYLIVRRAKESSTQVPPNGLVLKVADCRPADCRPGDTFFNGQVVVGVGSSNAFKAENLTSATDYVFDVYAYNGANETIAYLAKPLTGTARTANPLPI